VVAAAVGLRRRLWEQGVFTADDGGTWRVEADNLLICERNAEFLVAIAMGTEPVRLPAGSSRQSSPVVHLAF
jgi:alpha-glucosidase